VIGISSIARLDEADTLVTDTGLADEAREIASEAVRELVLASADGETPADAPADRSGRDLAAAGAESGR
jgi:hypothetical protein